MKKLNNVFAPMIVGISFGFMISIGICADMISDDSFLKEDVSYLENTNLFQIKVEKKDIV